MRGRLSSSAGWPLFAADVDQSVQERAGRDDQAATAVSTAVLQFETNDSPPLREDAARFTDDPGQVGHRLERISDPFAVDPLVRLCPRGPHCRAAAPIQQLELDAGLVDGAGHQPAERVDFANQVSLGGAPHRGIARHVRDRVG
jgi:hypothetical protein